MRAGLLTTSLAAYNPPPVDRTDMLNEALIAGGIVAGAFLLGALLLSAASRRRGARGGDPDRAKADSPPPVRPASRVPGAPRAEEDALVEAELQNRIMDRRISRGVDVGDGILASLSKVARQLESSRVMIYTDPHAYEKQVRQSVQELDAAVVSLRACVVGPDSKVVRTAQFLESLEGRLADLRAKHGAQFEIKVDEEAVAVLGADQLDVMLEIAREAAQNALAHGHSKIVAVRLVRDERAVTLTVQDNGRGFAPNLVGSQGKGMPRMRALALGMGGKLDLTTRIGNGTKVSVSLPVPAASAA